MTAFSFPQLSFNGQLVDIDNISLKDLTGFKTDIEGASNDINAKLQIYNKWRPASN